MDKLLFLLRFCLLAVSCGGYVLWLTKYVRCEFAVGITFSGIGSVLFLAGILNLLPEAAWLICLFGAFLFVENVRGGGGRSFGSFGVRGCSSLWWRGYSLLSCFMAANFTIMTIFLTGHML